MEQRVLLRIPSGNGLVSDRFTAVDIDTAKDLIYQGSQDDRSWFAGAHIVRDKEDYPRYGYKECKLNGVVKDDEAIHASRALYEEYLNSRNRADDLSDETEGSLIAELQSMRDQIAELKAESKKSEAQKESEVKSEARKVVADKAKVSKAKTKE